MTTNKTAYVVGFMGSGKSSILKVINQSTNINTVDLDELVVKDNGESILKIFRNHGEEYFRKKEEESFYKIKNMPETIIFLGGGSLVTDSIRTTIQQSENSFYLQNTFDNLWENIKNSDRPLVNTGKKNVMKIYNERLDSYEQCKNTIDMSNSSLKEASKLIVSQLGWI